MIQSGKILIFGKKPERSLRVRLFGVGKKFVPLMQGFKNSGKGWGGGKFSPVGWEESEIFLRGGGGDCFTGWREPEDEWFWQFKPFSNLETAFCEYWISIKFKIKRTRVSKEYEIKTMDQDQCLQLKMLLLLSYNLKIVI